MFASSSLLMHHKPMMFTMNTVNGKLAFMNTHEHMCCYGEFRSIWIRFHHLTTHSESQIWTVTRLVLLHHGVYKSSFTTLWNPGSLGPVHQQGVQGGSSPCFSYKSRSIFQISSVLQQHSGGVITRMFVDNEFYAWIFCNVITLKFKPSKKCKKYLLKHK